MTAKFYRYIYKERNGYCIRHNGESYGHYNNLADALYDRDRLEAVDWDIQTWTELMETPNHYKAITLPAFEDNDNYIRHVKEHWTIQKRVNGKMKHFGVFYSLEEAKEKRNELISNDWKEVEE